MKKKDLQDRLTEAQETIDQLEWIIQQKQGRIVELLNENDRLALTHEPPKIKKEKKLPKWCGTISFDLWPISDWFRLSYSPYKLGKYAQICIGPLRLDWYSN